MVNNIYINFFRSTDAATNESTVAQTKETTAIPPGKTTNNFEMKRLLSLKCVSRVKFLAFFVSIMNFQLGLWLSLLFHASTEETTAAPGENTTGVPPGKTPNNTEQKKIQRSSII